MGVEYWGREYDVHDQWLEFDGRLMHYTLPPVGERVSLVFHTCSRLSEAPARVRNEVWEAGFDFDWHEANLSPWAEKPEALLLPAERAVEGMLSLSSQEDRVSNLMEDLAPTGLVEYEAIAPERGAWGELQSPMGLVPRTRLGRPGVFGYGAARKCPPVDGTRGVFSRGPEAGEASPAGPWSRAPRGGLRRERGTDEGAAVPKSPPSRVGARSRRLARFRGRKEGSVGPAASGPRLIPRPRPLVRPSAGLSADARSCFLHKV